MLLLAVGLWLQEPELPPLVPGEVHSGIITANTGEVRPEHIDPWTGFAPIRGATFAIELPGAGHAYVELHSYEFDGYLVLRNSAGEVLAESDAGWYGNHARLLFEADPAVSYRIDACALHGRVGEFRLAIYSGAPSAMTAAERLAEAESDAEVGVRILRERDGEESETHAYALSHLAEVLYAAGKAREALEPSKQGLRLRAQLLGREHADTATSFNEIATFAYVLGDLKSAETLYRNALHIRRNALGPDHPWTADSIQYLGQTYVQLGRHADAQPLLREAYETRERLLGREHKSTVVSLNHYGLCVENTAGQAVAREIFEQALSLAEVSHGPDAPFTASVMQALGRCYSSLGMGEEAERLLVRAVEVLERHDVASLQRALALLALAQHFLAFDRFAEALPAFERARSAALEHGDPRLPTLNRIRFGLAQSLASEERWSEAAAVYAELVANADAGDENNRALKSKGEIGILHVRRGYSAQGVAAIEPVLSQAEERFGPTHTTTLRYQIALADAYMALGSLGRSRDLLEDVLVRIGQVGGRDHELWTTAEKDLCAVLEDQGFHAEARFRLTTLRDRIELDRGRATRAWLTTTGELATTLSSLGLWSESREMLAEAITTWRELLHEHTALGSSLHNNLAIVLWRLGEGDAAEAAYLEALALSRAKNGPESPRLFHPLNNLATFYRSASRLEEARATLREAERVLGDLEAANPVQLAVLQTNLGRTLNDLGREEEAAASFMVAVKTAERAFEFGGAMHARMLEQAAFFATDRGDFEQGWELATSALAIRRDFVDRELHRLAENEQFRFFAAQREVLHLVLSLAPRLGEREVAAAYAALLDWKGRATRTLLAGRSGALRALDEAGTASLTELRRIQSRMSRILHTPLGRSDPEGLALQLGSLRESAAVLERQLQVDGQASRSPSPSAVAAAIPPGACLVDFYVHPVRQSVITGRYEPAGPWDEDRLVAFVAQHGDRQPRLVDLGPARAITETLRSAGRAIDTARGGAAVAARSSNLLREQIWEPLSDAVGDASTLFVVPDGVLGGFPLEVIPLDDERFLVESLSVVYLQDAWSLLTANEVRTSGGEGLFLVGGVDYGGDSKSRWTALPAAAAEATALEGLHASSGAGGKVMALRGDHATEEAIKSGLQNYPVLHLATHGFFEPFGVGSLWRQAMSAEHEETQRGKTRQVLNGVSAGLLSGLICSGANAQNPSDVEDGYLTAEEVAWLDLSGADLVVLSACETALGRAEEGEGMLGLRRAFHLAGARTVISSLWAIDDESTRALMESFYRNLWMGGQGKHEALRNAQLEMLRRNRAAGDARPETWGAFVLSGDWR